MLAPIASRGTPKVLCAAKPIPQAAREALPDPRVTLSQLALYTISTFRGDRFPHIRSHWGSAATRIYRNNPLIGLPNQHIVGLTYVP